MNGSDHKATTLLGVFALGFFLGVFVEWYGRRQDVHAPATAETAKPVEADSAWEKSATEKNLADLQRRLDAQVLRIDEHGSRLHDLEILNRAQCK